MPNAALDTYKAVKRLTAAGVPEPQAVVQVEVIKDLMADELVTKDYLDKRLGELRTELREEMQADRQANQADHAAIRAEMAANQSRNEAEFATVRQEMAANHSRNEAEFVTVRQEFQAEFAAVRSDIASLRSEMNMAKWVLGGIGFGMVLLLLKGFVPGF